MIGRVLHRLASDAAIGADLLTDYQVVVIGVTKAEPGQGDAPAGLRKTITFHSAVAKAQRFTNAAVPDSLPAVIDRMSRRTKPSGHTARKGS